MKKYSVLGVSAGAGTLLYPFKHHLIANVEPRGVFHTKGEPQWALNFGKIPFLKDGLDPKWEPNIILSSPDCGASSIMRLSHVKKMGDPVKNPSLNLVLQAVDMYKPDIFVIENLPRLLSFIPTEVWLEKYPNYDIIFHQSSVMEFGNSQKSRLRLLIIGVLKSQRKFKLKQFTNKFQVRTPRITRKLLEVAISSRNYNIPLNKVLAMYDYRRLPERENLTVSQIHELWNGPFKDEKKWPIKTKKMKTLPGVYKLDPDRYPMTVRPADRQFRPDGMPLGIDDYRIIMGFPKRYKIYMDKGNYLYWLNKARYTLCKGAVYEVGLWLKRCINLRP